MKEWNADRAVRCGTQFRAFSSLHLSSLGIPRWVMATFA